MPSDARKMEEIAKKAIIDRFSELVAEYHRLTKEADDFRSKIAENEKQKKNLEAEAQDCHAAARVFKFDLIQAMKTGPARTEGQQEAQAQLPPGIPQASSQPTVKALVLEAAKQAYPKPVRAADLRVQFERRGLKIHEKTIGMTLYRWLKRKELRRDGWDWFFVPEDQREAAPSTDKENSGVSAPEQIDADN